MWLLVPASAIASIFVKLSYLLVRVSILSSLAEGCTVVDWLVLALEAFISLPTLLKLTTRSTAWRRPREPSQPLRLSDPPRVDIFITCCNERLPTILETLHAALNLDYPHDKFNVIVLDDGGSDELQRTVNQLQNSHRNLFYTARQKPSMPDYKAGNLNHGVAFSATLATNPTAFFAGLDADTIVHPHWLRVVMAQMTSDTRLALVATPQYFHNIPRNDILGQAFFRYQIERAAINDAIDVGDCQGTGYVVRRSALADVGGWQTDTSSEDSCASLMLLGAGYKVQALPGVFHVGEVPESLFGFIRQKTRWNTGNIQNALKTKFRLYGAINRHCTLRQRLGGFETSTIVIILTFWPLVYVGLAVQLLSGQSLVAYGTNNELRSLLRLASATTLFDWCHQATLAPTTGAAVAFGFQETDCWLTPYYFLAFLKTYVLSRRLGGSKPVFTSSGSLQSELHERDPFKRVSLKRRARVMLVSYGFWLHLGFVVICAISVLRIWRTPTEPGPMESWKVLILTTIAWPPLHWFRHACSCMIPLWYIAAPPDKPVEVWTTTKNGAARYPTRSGPERTAIGNTFDYIEHIMALYALLCLVASFQS